MPDDRIACGHCGTVDVEVSEQATPSQTSSSWPYIDRAVLSCRRCHHHWIRVDLVRPQVAAG
ncbi:MAG TPA: hypothetical protein VHX15_00920 [Frankiaceae bacterium]|nr:hypothetical protein [Frankiaceae bacterium]